MNAAEVRAAECEAAESEMAETETARANGCGGRESAADTAMAGADDGE